jgi:hypothetical protein
MPLLRFFCTLFILPIALHAEGSTLGRAGVGFYRHLPGLDFAVAASAPDGSLVVGGTASASGLPVTPNAVQSTFGASQCPTGGIPYVPLCAEGYVARFASDSTLLYGTYLGGGASVEVVSVTAGPDGAIYAAVLANAGVIGAPNPVSLDGATHFYILKLSADPSGSITGFMVGAAPKITPAKLVLDQNGNIYVAGSCGIGTLAATSGAFEQQASGLGQAGCVLSFSPDSTSPRYATYIGASQTSIADLAVDDQGNAYLAGSTINSDFPGASLGWNGVQPGTLGFTSSYGFVAVLDASGSSILWSSVFGSPVSGGSTELLRNTRGEIAVVGLAVKNPMFMFNTDLSPLKQISVVKFSGDPTQPVYSVQVAAGIDNSSVAAAMDDSGSVLLTGVTSFLQPGGFDFPPFDTTADALERSVSGTKTRFFLRLAASDGSVQYSSFFGPDQQSFTSQVVLGNGQRTYVLMSGGMPMDLSFYGGPALSTGLPGTAMVLFEPNLAPARARLSATNAANLRPDALAAGALITLSAPILDPRIS